MGASTNISWCDHTFNIVWGCVKISPGCANCYADAFARRTGHDVWGVGKRRRTFGPKHWSEPYAWDEAAKRECRRRRVFCSSMTDWALDDADLDAERPKLWDLVRRTRFLDWLLLTKRPEAIRELLPPDLSRGHAGIWQGVSVEDREHGLPRVDVLRRIPAAVRFLSIEPLLEDLGELDLAGIHWVIVGGESGPKFRPMHLDWARRIRDRCRAAGVAFFFKQASAVRPGKGDVLDGVAHKEFPR